MTHVYQGVFAVTVPDEKVPGYPDRRRVLCRSRVRGRLAAAEEAASRTYA